MTKIENAVPLSHQRIVVPAGLHIQLYIRSGDAHGARAGHKRAVSGSEFLATFVHGGVCKDVILFSAGGYHVRLRKQPFFRLRACRP